MKKKDKRNNYGVKGFSSPTPEFFNYLIQPINKDMINKTKDIFKGCNKLKIKNIEE